MTLEQHVARCCLQFSGDHNARCRAGVRYADVRQDAPDYFRTLPCFTDGPDTCAFRRFPGSEQVAAEVAAFRERQSK